MKPRLRMKADGTFAWKLGGWMDGPRETGIWVRGYLTAEAALAAAQLSASRRGTAMFDTIEVPTGADAAPVDLAEMMSVSPAWLRAAPPDRFEAWSRYRK